MQWRASHGSALAPTLLLRRRYSGARPLHKAPMGENGEMREMLRIRQWLVC